MSPGIAGLLGFISGLAFGVLLTLVLCVRHPWLVVADPADALHDPGEARWSARKQEGEE